MRINRNKYYWYNWFLSWYLLYIYRRLLFIFYNEINFLFINIVYKVIVNKKIMVNINLVKVFVFLFIFGVEIMWLMDG